LKTKEQLRSEPLLLEICLDGRNLTDEGLHEVVEGLKDAIRMENGVPFFALAELNLAHNGLTSSGHLKDLDLSGNCVKVVEQTELDDWEVFLESFKHCFAVRRLVLSDSDLSGSMALEKFTKCYSQSPATDPESPYSSCSLLPFSAFRLMADSL
jgi:hypothetical protein